MPGITKSSSGEGVVVSRESDHWCIYSVEYGWVTLPTDTEDSDDLALGDWVEFGVERRDDRSDYRDIKWKATTAYVMSFSWPFKVVGGRLVLKDIDAMVTHISDNFMLLWSEVIGRMAVEKDTVPALWSSFKLFDTVVVDAKRTKWGEIRDIFWKVSKIQNVSTVKSSWSYKEVKAQLSDFCGVMDRYALLKAEGCPTIFMTFFDYFIHHKDAFQFKAALNRVPYFRVLIVPNQKHFKNQWRAIFVEPWDDSSRTSVEPISSVSDGSFESDVREIDQPEFSTPSIPNSSSSAEEETCPEISTTSVTTETEVQTESLQEWSWFSSMCQDPNVCQLLRENHPSFVRKIKLAITGRHRLINSVDWRSDKKSIDTECTQNDGNRSVEVQTNELIEKEIIYKLMQDKDIDSYMDKQHEQLWEQMYFSLYALC